MPKRPAERMRRVWKSALQRILGEFIHVSYFAMSFLSRVMFSSDEERSVAGSDDEEYADVRNEVEITPKVGYVCSDSSVVLHGR